jgi:hypothetical protein
VLFYYNGENDPLNSFAPSIFTIALIDNPNDNNKNGINAIQEINGVMTIL